MKHKHTPYYILHGLNGSPNGDWMPWIENELKERGEKVFVLGFPNPEMPKLKEWLKTIKDAVKKHGEGIIVGHSLGGTTAMRFLEKGGHAQKVILVASPFEKIFDIPQINEFVDKPYKIPKTKFKDTAFIVIGSEDDPFVPPNHAEAWAKLLKVEPLIFKEKGHFNEETFPEILEYL